MPAVRGWLRSKRRPVAVWPATLAKRRPGRVHWLIFVPFHWFTPFCPPAGWRWYVSFWRLVLFAVLLLPGFMQMMAFYFFSPRMLRSIPYGLLVRLPVRPIARLLIEQHGCSARSAAVWLVPHAFCMHIYFSMRCWLLLKDPSLSHHPSHPTTPRTPPHAAAQPPGRVPAAQGVASGGAAPNRHLHHRRGVDHRLQRRAGSQRQLDSWGQLRTLLTSAAWDAGWGMGDWSVGAGAKNSGPLPEALLTCQLEQLQRSMPSGSPNVRSLGRAAGAAAEPARRARLLPRLPQLPAGKDSAPASLICPSPPQNLGKLRWAAATSPSARFDYGHLFIINQLLPTPQGNALDMLQDVNTGIAWVLRHAPAFGGDGKSFHLVGQSVRDDADALPAFQQHAVVWAAVRAAVATLHMLLCAELPALGWFALHAGGRAAGRPGAHATDAAGADAAAAAGGVAGLGPLAHPRLCGRQVGRVARRMGRWMGTLAGFEEGRCSGGSGS